MWGNFARGISKLGRNIGQDIKLLRYKVYAAKGDYILLLNNDIQVITPDLKSMTWLNSYGDKIITSGTEQSLKVINITEHELYIPLEDVCTHLKNVACVLP